MDYPWAKPGAKVVCVRDEPGTGTVWGERERPEAGAVYTIAEVWVDAIGELALEFVELRRDADVHGAWGYRVGYFARRFRPLHDLKSDIAMFQRIADKAGHRVPEGV